jgi:hypothetical protein
MIGYFDREDAGTVRRPMGRQNPPGAQAEAPRIAFGLKQCS